MSTIEPRRLKHPLLWVLCALLPGCALFQRPPRPVHVSPQEPVEVTFPDLPTPESVSLSGPMVVAIQLAMEDFLPWDTEPHKGATPREVCLYKRESYNVIASPEVEGVIFVEIYPRPGACEMGGPAVKGFDVIYAIDVKNWRILTVER